jgi:hypothetical protein
MEERNRLKDVGVKWENNIKTDCQEMRCQGVNWILSGSRTGESGRFLYGR